MKVRDIVGFLILLITATVGDLVSEELRSRLDRVPYAILRVAIRRLPVEVRQNVGNEWLAELHHIVHRTEGLPITRLLSAIRYALGLLWTARRIGRNLKIVRGQRNAGSQKSTCGLSLHRQVAIVGAASVGVAGIGIAAVEATMSYWGASAPSAVAYYAEVTVGKGPLSVAVSPDGHRAYISNYVSDTVSVINTGTNAVIGTIPVGENPVSVAVSPNGRRAYITNDHSNTVSVVDTGTNAVIDTIPVGENPWGVAVSPDGHRAYVTNAYDSITVIDTTTNTVTATLSGHGSPRCVAVSPDGRDVYATNFASGDVSAVDIGANAVTGVIPVGDGGAWGVAVSPNGRRVYITNEHYNTVSVIDTGNNAVISTITVGSGPEGVAFSPDGRRAYIANARSGTVSVIKISG